MVTIAINAFRVWRPSRADSGRLSTSPAPSPESNGHENERRSFEEWPRMMDNSRREARGTALALVRRRERLHLSPKTAQFEREVDRIASCASFSSAIDKHYWLEIRTGTIASHALDDVQVDGITANGTCNRDVARFRWTAQQPSTTLLAA